MITIMLNIFSLHYDKLNSSLDFSKAFRPILLKKRLICSIDKILNREIIYSDNSFYRLHNKLFLCK
jgi:hypothetical protein